MMIELPAFIGELFGCIEVSKSGLYWQTDVDKPENESIQD